MQWVRCGGSGPPAVAVGWDQGLLGDPATAIPGEELVLSFALVF